MKNNMFKIGVVIMAFGLFSSCLKDKVGYVEIKGTITEGAQKSTLEWLDKLYKTRGLKGLFVKVNSPGGSGSLSYELFSKIKKFSEKGIKVVVYISEQAASGGYFVSCAGDYIVANPNSLVGSIGVIALVPDITDLMKKIGVKVKIVKKGRYKDVLNPFSPISPEQESLIDTLLGDMYIQFLEIVARSRKMSVDKVNEIAEGKIYTGRMAYKLGLVDTVGSEADAIEILKKMNNIKRPIYWLKMKKKKSLLSRILGEMYGIKIWY